MHHTLRFYGAHLEQIIRFYMFGAKFTRLPVIGRLVTALINWYARTQHSASILTAEEAKRVIDMSQASRWAIARAEKSSRTVIML